MVEERGNGFGIAALVLGILGILSSGTLLLSVLALIFAIVQRRRYPNKIATAGFVLGIIGIILSVVIILIWGFALLFFSGSYTQYDSGGLILGSESELDYPFSGISHSFNVQEGSADLTLRNDAEGPVLVTEILFDGKGYSSGIDCLWTGAVTIEDREQAEFTIGPGCDFSRGQYTADVEITYSNVGQTGILQANGTIEGY